MKLLPRITRNDVRVARARSSATSQDSLGHGLDAVIVIALFLLAGYGLDRLFRTTPVMMIVMVTVGAVGLFATFKHRYDQRMAEHDAEFRARLAGRTRVGSGSADTSESSRREPRA